MTKHEHVDRIHQYRVRATPERLPPDPGSEPIPEGHVRLWPYTPLENAASIKAQGLKREYAQGDAMNGDLSDPSAGVWASTKRPDELLNSHDSAKAVVEYHAPPEEISGQAESPWHAYRKSGSYDADKVAEWAEGYHHVIMRGDVPPENITAIHEPWHAAGRYLRDDMARSGNPHEYDWINEGSAARDPIYDPYRRGLRALRAEPEAEA